jgi:hypothetical protein
MGLGDVWGKTHDRRKVRKRTDYRCSTSLGGIRVVDLYFPVGGTTAKIIEQMVENNQDLVKSYSEG